MPVRRTRSDPARTVFDHDRAVFMWGFMTVFNDILIPRSRRRSPWITPRDAGAVRLFWRVFYRFADLFCHFRHTSDPIARLGYKNGVIIGLLISATGSAFLAGGHHGFLQSFSGGSVHCRLGFAMLQIAANPYVHPGPRAHCLQPLNLLRPSILSAPQRSFDRRIPDLPIFSRSGVSGAIPSKCLT